MSLFQLRMQWQHLKRSEKPASMKIAYLSTFTIHPLEPYLGVALAQEGHMSDGLISPYNQIVQECLTDDSLTARFQPDVLVVWPTLDDLWTGKPRPLTVESGEGLIEEALELADATLEASRRWGAQLVFVLPAVSEQRPLGAGDASNVAGVFSVSTAVREALRRRLARKLGVLVVDSEEVIRDLGYAHSYNERMQYLARIPYTEEAFHAIGSKIARLVLMSRTAPRKLLVLDADHTLWGGVVGEDGVEGLDLADNGKGEAFKAFQSYLLEIRRSGVLLAVCSKNNEQDVWAVFEQRREMRLKKEHLAAWRINWQPKSENIRQIAEELGLGLDSIVFIDDNPMEIAEVQQSLPEVACIQMPADPATAIRIVQASGALDRLPPTIEDLGRADYYKQEQERKMAASALPVSPEAYRAGLNIAVRTFAPLAADMARLTQLVNKTNQFNLNCRRRTEAELAALVKDPSYIVLLAECSDRYGDYGTVGAMIAKLEGGKGELDTFVLSCRALGRGVEEAMLVGLLERAAEQGVMRLKAIVEEHPRNEPARAFFATMGCPVAGEAGVIEGVCWPAYIARMTEVMVS
ncbi:HAD-IIIC family phosphatase [Paenibacillus sp. SYP-B4298]|uniref:HAD-IIIC family phosphatase n=1 Tax=Paenibacillus sp. SYP-B4298 TaxID=2996034 RepID=UPI0022DE1833|nr:HAD-IIIC family phosphatase [Paenibacillus sp. SYP-B4298]